jgi:hypothetical protein
MNIDSPRSSAKVFVMSSEIVARDEGKSVGDDLEKQLVGKFSTSSAFRKKMTPQDITWDNVNFSVKGKSILQDVWGSVRILRLLFPSLLLAVEKY